MNQKIDMEYLRINTLIVLGLDLKKLSEFQEVMMHMVGLDLKGPITNVKSLNGFLKKNLEKLPAVENEQTGTDGNPDWGFNRIFRFAL